jgi:antitoxin YefM
MGYIILRSTQSTHKGDVVTTIAIDRDQKIAVLSERERKELEKAKSNAEYLEKLERSFRQLEEGRVVVKTMEELEAMAK